MANVTNTPAEQQRRANMEIFDHVRNVPATALKKIIGGRLKGKSDINPVWRFERMTEVFGACGFGWRYTVERQWTETYGREVKCFCNVLLYVRDPKTKEWSEAIPGTGGSAMIDVEKNGIYVNDEAYKMALTDALSVAMKALGVAADIYMGCNDLETKYEVSSRPHYNPAPATPAAASEPAQAAPAAITEREAIDKLKAVKSRDELNDVWSRIKSAVPAFADKEHAVYKLVCTLCGKYPKAS